MCSGKNTHPRSATDGLSQFVLSEPLDAFRDGDGVRLVRDAVRLVMQELIEVEATERIGADRYERSDTRTTERNGLWHEQPELGQRGSSGISGWSEVVEE